MLGLCGVFIAIIQASIAERHDIYKFFAPDHDCHHEHAIFLWISYIIASWLAYTGIARFLQVSEVALLNLNFLTADLYAVVFSVFAEGVVPSEFYFFALFCIIIGVYIYETAPSPVGPLDSDQIAAEDINNQEAYKGDKDFEPVKLPPTHNVGIKEGTLEMI